MRHKGDQHAQPRDQSKLCSAQKAPSIDLMRSYAGTGWPLLCPDARWYRKGILSGLCPRVSGTLNLMFQVSRGLYRALAPRVEARNPQEAVARQVAVLRACEGIVTRMATDRRSISN